jgi:hypothetical protein
MRALGVRGLPCVVLALFALGCHRPTEIVVVVDTDLTLGTDFDLIQFGFSNTAFQSEAATATQLPATLGVVPPNANTPAPRFPGQDGTLALTVSAAHAGGGGAPVSMHGVPIQNAAVVTRGVSGLRFVNGEERMLFVPLYRRCMCQGTMCPNLTDADCKDITMPVLSDFDQDHLPRIVVTPTSMP